MDEEPLSSPGLGKGSLQEDVGRMVKPENRSETSPSHGSSMHPDSPLNKVITSPNMEAEIKEEDPPVDWLEPLEDDEEDDARSLLGRNDGEEESLAGESERSESVAGSEKGFKKGHHLRAPRGKRSHPDEGWDDWPALGPGWKRKEVIRRSGSSIGQKDVYYMGPKGDRVRSRVELVSVLQGIMDLSNYDYKSGQFLDSTRPIRTRRTRKKLRESSSSESSYMERGEGADTPDSYHRLTPVPMPKPTPSQQTGPLSQSAMNTPKLTRSDDQRESDRIKLPMPSSSKRLPLPSINGAIGSEDSILICARCGTSFTGTWYDRQRKRPCCPSCWASKTREHPMIRFRKWIPCGQCVGCHNTTNCGQCANCKHNVESPESRKRVCRKRKCICPIRKGTGGTNFLLQSMHKDVPDNYDDTSFQSEFAESQNASLKNSDTENIANMDDDDDDLSTDDDDDWHKKRKRRACGECKACLSRKDCGTCDFCVDKPKFGGSNKKRQKCRQRQCQRQAMRHLLPFQMGQGDFGQEAPMIPGRPRPHYTYSRKSTYKKSKEASDDFDFSDNGDDDDDPTPVSNSDSGQRNGLYDRHSHISHHNYSQDPLSRDVGDKAPPAKDAQRPYDDDDGDDDDDYDDEEEEMPMITQIYSLADYPPPTGTIEGEGALMKLLHSLRTSALPILWYAIMVEGPQLQLIQCSKQSSMTDTMVLIDPGFFYQVTVQKQPLFPTHPLYDNFPARLTSTTEVVNLLLGLEKYSVCQGLPPKDPLPRTDPIVLERASTCDFLVNKNVSICDNCKALERL